MSESKESVLAVCKKSLVAAEQKVKDLEAEQEVEIEKAEAAVKVKFRPRFSKVRKEIKNLSLQIEIGNKVLAEARKSLGVPMRIVATGSKKEKYYERHGPTILDFLARRPGTWFTKEDVRFNLEKNGYEGRWSEDSYGSAPSILHKATFNGEPFPLIDMDGKGHWMVTKNGLQGMDEADWDADVVYDKYCRQPITRKFKGIAGNKVDHGALPEPESPSPTPIPKLPIPKLPAPATQSNKLPVEQSEEKETDAKPATDTRPAESGDTPKEKAS